MYSDAVAERLSALVGDFASRRILVVGDVMLDEFVWGKVSRISPEAPVPVVNVTGESYYPGGAANVARNLREFTPSTAVMGACGDDAAGRRLLSLLAAAGIDTSRVRQDGSYTTAVKTRIIARSQQVVRVDRERPSRLSRAELERAVRDFEAAMPEVDAVIVADYGKGFLSQELADALVAAAGRHKKILTVDPHPNTLLSWKGATAVKPNRAEAFLAAGLPVSEPVAPAIEDAALLAAGQRLLERWGCGSLLITLGEHGMLLFEPGAPPYPVATRAKTVFDVSGAGDTAAAVFTLALAVGGTPTEAAELANCASGVVVGKLGTATVTLSELQSSLAEP